MVAPEQLQLCLGHCRKTKRVTELCRSAKLAFSFKHMPQVVHPDHLALVQPRTVCISCWRWFKRHFHLGNDRAHHKWCEKKCSVRCHKKMMKWTVRCPRTGLLQRLRFSVTTAQELRSVKSVAAPPRVTVTHPACAPSSHHRHPVAAAQPPHWADVVVACGLPSRIPGVAPDLPQEDDVEQQLWAALAASWVDD